MLALARTSPDLLVGRARVEHLARHEVGDPEHLTDVFGELPEALLAVAQRLLGLPARSHVGDGPREVGRPPAVVPMVRPVSDRPKEPDAAVPQVLKSGDAYDLRAFRTLQSAE